MTSAGRPADRRSLPVLAGGGAALLSGRLMLALTAAGHAVATLLLVPVQGLPAFGVGSALITRVPYEATDAPLLGDAFATSALNVGAALGPVLGGAAIGGGPGYRSPVWVSVLLMISSLAALDCARQGGRERQPA
ncbi:Cmx [Streptomyces sp. NPDC048191]|uniref:Cmx n=1 Tax=Streptomyces sp. NPDC048191 TaxID=3155484 RepID=UPI0033CB12BD